MSIRARGYKVTAERLIQFNNPLLRHQLRVSAAAHTRGVEFEGNVIANDIFKYFRNFSFVPFAINTQSEFSVYVSQRTREVGKYVDVAFFKHTDNIIKVFVKIFFGFDFPHLGKVNLRVRHIISAVPHGGAVIEENSTSSVKIPFALREMEQSDAKTEIAKQAAELIKDDDVLFLDASSSACALVPFIAVKKRITVITSGLQTMQKLGEYGVKVISTGGELIPSCRSLVGECAYKTIGAFNADAVFFSCRGISVDGYITDISEAENNVCRRMIARSDRSYLLCADKKVGKKFFHNLCTTKDITGVISNAPLPEFDF